MTDFHEGHHKSLRFSAANVTLSHTFEEKTAPNSDDWMTRSETIFRGIVVRCGALCDPTADLAVSDWLHKLAEGDQAEPAVFRERFSARTGDGQPADEQVTPELRCFMAGFEKTLGGRLCGLVIRNGELLLAPDRLCLCRHPQCAGSPGYQRHPQVVRRFPGGHEPSAGRPAGEPRDPPRINR